MEKYKGRVRPLYYLEMPSTIVKLEFVDFEVLFEAIIAYLDRRKINSNISQIISFTILGLYDQKLKLEKLAEIG